MDFYDDAVVLIKSFYPRTEVMQYQEQAEQTRTAQDIVIEPEVSEKDGRSKKELHEAFKCRLYTKLSAQLNKTLPWGYLTGVRPSKIAYTLLEKGADREQILEEFTKKHLVSEKKAQLALQVAQTEKSILEKMDYKNGYSVLSDNLSVLLIYILFAGGISKQSTTVSGSFIKGNEIRIGSDAWTETGYGLFWRRNADDVKRRTAGYVTDRAGAAV